MAGPSVDGRISRAIAAVVFIGVATFALIILGVWTSLILSFVGLTSWPAKRDVNTMLIAFAISLGILCAVLWSSEQVGIIRLKEKTETRLWRTLIAAVLTALAAGIAKALR
jgi:hypothetical protein